MQVIGKMASVEKVVLHGRIHLRPLQWELRRLLAHPTSLDVSLQVSPALRSHLQWWLNASHLAAGVPIHPLPSEVDVVTDASLEGWGALCLDQQTKGKWSSQDMPRHINFKELKAVWLALMHFQEIITGKRVRILSDNSVTGFYINK